jgi:hypothetical protein
MKFKIEFRILFLTTKIKIIHNKNLRFMKSEFDKLRRIKI